MPMKEGIVDHDEDLDFDPEVDNLFYSSSLDNCLFEDSEYRATWSQVGDQDMWRNHSSNKFQISLCGGLSRAWKEGMTEITELKKNLRTILKKSDGEEVSKRELVKLFYRSNSPLFRAYQDKLAWPHRKFL